ncbi:unnamed protein product [Pleuronectes platessa]|uniref:Alkylated DNA repair protein AlkB homologue 8 N-terminal domain-containing protein n=1 Tax=Pleuronectes platessa TaxID=8262 RepID=A0A9N7UCI4_PLEPL|nr:unnamed protein product [Pleuronectes platessa]
MSVEIAQRAWRREVWMGCARTALECYNWCLASCLSPTLFGRGRGNRQQQQPPPQSTGTQWSLLRSTNTWAASLTDNLKFSINTEEILRRCQHRQHLQRTLNSLGAIRDILRTFYCSFIESVITFSITGWSHSTSLQHRNRLQIIVCSKIIRLPLRSLTNIYEQQTRRTSSPLTWLQDSEEKGNLCSHGCSTPQLLTPPNPIQNHTEVPPCQSTDIHLQTATATLLSN